MAEFKSVEHTRPIELLFLILSTIFVLVVSLYILFFFNLKIATLIIPFIISAIYFYSIKHRFIKKSDFKIGTKWVEINDKRIEFENILNYSIYWMNGVEIKLKMKNNEKLRITANDLFCDTDKFISMVNDLEKHLKKYNNGIIEKKGSYLDTKVWHYFLIFITIIYIGVLIHGIVTKKEFPTSIFIGLFALGTLWSGIKK